MLANGSWVTYEQVAVTVDFDLLMIVIVFTYQ